MLYASKYRSLQTKGLEPALPDVPLLPYTTGCIPVEVCKPELLVTATVPFNDKSQLEDLFGDFVAKC